MSEHEAKRAAVRARHAIRWQDVDAAESYRYRATYPDETFDILDSLFADGNRAVLDLGCGTGNVTRPLAARVDRIDAVDISAEMIAVAKTLPGGDAPNIRWQQARAEEATLDPPYGLIVGGASMHWMDYRVLLPKLARALAPGGALAVLSIPGSAALGGDQHADAWDPELTAIIARYSTDPDYEPFDMITAWESAGVFRLAGHRTTSPVAVEQPIEDFIAGYHAASTLTRAHIDADAFDAEVRALLSRHCPDGVVRRRIIGDIVWGTPLDPA